MLVHAHKKIMSYREFEERRNKIKIVVCELIFLDRESVSVALESSCAVGLFISMQCAVNLYANTNT